MVKLKICGMRRAEDIEIANSYKPDYIGFVFAESPRKVSYEQAQDLSGLLSEDIVSVGVFVNEHMKLIVDLFKDGIIEMAQLHGDEDEKYIRNLKDKSIEETGKQIPVINAIEIKEGADYDDELLKWRDSASDYFILDSGKGSGKTFDWSLIDKESEMQRILLHNFQRMKKWCNLAITAIMNACCRVNCAQISMMLIIN